MSRSTTRVLIGAAFALAIASLESVAQTRQPASPAIDTLQQRRAAPVPAPKPPQPSATATRPVAGKPMTVRDNPQKLGVPKAAQTTKPIDIKKEKQKVCFSQCLKRSGYSGKGEVSTWGVVTGHPLYACMAKCGMVSGQN
jgi:hypothetical protein